MGTEKKWYHNTSAETDDIFKNPSQQMGNDHNNNLVFDKRMNTNFNQNQPNAHKSIKEQC